MKKINYKSLIIYVLFPLVLGTIVGFISNISGYSNQEQFIPKWVFPVVWSILYILMGISSYLVRGNKKLIDIYKVNLAINYLWPIIFFNLKLEVLAFFWILFLIIIVGYMIYEFYKENKVAAYLLIPYIVWLVIASFLNLSLIV